MTAAAGIVPGARILASAARNAWPVAVIKAIDETEGVTLASPATLVNDKELYLPVAAGTTYLMCCYLDYEGNTRGSGDLEYEWTVPSGAAARFITIGQTTAGAVQISSTQQDTTRYHLATGGLGTLMAAVMIGTLVTSTASGTLHLEWSTYQDNGTHTIIHAQSFLALWQLSP